MEWRKIIKDNRALEFLLDTPSKHWVVVGGVHFHKSFWGSLSLFASILLALLDFPAIVYAILIIFGFIYILLSVLGHIYTHNKPYFKWWDIEKRPWRDMPRTKRL